MLTLGYEAMSRAAFRMHGRGNFESAYDSALMMTNTTMNKRRNQLIDWPYLERQEKVSSQKNCRAPVMQQKLLCP